jgi:hypothetical protein
MNYWLAPNGRVWAEEKIGAHYERALSIIDEKYEWMIDEMGMFPHNIDAVQFLEEKGYIRYMDWSEKPQWIIYNQKPTRQQIKKMYELTGYVSL